MMKKMFLPLLLMVAVSAQAADKIATPHSDQGSENPVLTIEGGQVQGVLADDHPDVFVYRGIPYAAPPIKENRWKEPQPIVPWKGVKICDRLFSILVVTSPSGGMAKRLRIVRTAYI